MTWVLGLLLVLTTLMSVTDVYGRGIGPLNAKAVPFVVGRRALNARDANLLPIDSMGNADEEEQGSKNPPSFSWDSGRTSDSGVPILIVHFNDGGPDDEILLQSVAHKFPLAPGEDEESVNHCIYQGKLRNERPEVFVSLNGCPNTNTFDISFNSARLFNFMFSVENGVVTQIEPVNAFRKRSTNEEENEDEDEEEDDGDYDEDGEEEDEDEDELVFDLGGQKPSDVGFDTMAITKDDVDISLGETVVAQPDTPDQNMTRRRLPTSANFQLQMFVYYDTNFANKYGSEAANQARAIINLAQERFYWSSLTVKITLNVIKLEPLGQALVANYNGLVSAFYKSRATTTDANVYAYLSYDGDRPGVVGVAASLHGVCNSDRGYRTMITESFRSTLTTAEIFTHEVGHLLYMNHDFWTNSQGRRAYMRYDSQQRYCANIGSIMDYYQSTVNKWSGCSVDDFNYYYDAIIRLRGGFCMASGTALTTCFDTGRYCRYAYYFSCSHSYFVSYCKSTCNRC